MVKYNVLLEIYLTSEAEDSESPSEQVFEPRTDGLGGRKIATRKLGIAAVLDPSPANGMPAAR